MIANRREMLLGRLIVLAAIAFTLIPLLSMLSAALQPQGTIPRGFNWPSDPQWGNFRDAFNTANMAALLKSSLIIEVAVVPISVLMATMAGFALGELRIAGHKAVFVIMLVGLTMPFEVVITPLYYEMRDLGLLNTRWAIILPMIALLMSFGVFWMRSHFLNLPSEFSEAALVCQMEPVTWGGVGRGSGALGAQPRAHRCGVERSPSTPRPRPSPAARAWRPPCFPHEVRELAFDFGAHGAVVWFRHAGSCWRACGEHRWRARCALGGAVQGRAARTRGRPRLRPCPSRRRGL